MAVLAGANLIYGPGMLESGITFDFAQLVLDSDFVRMIKDTARGFVVDAESLAVDVIKSVGPSGDFLTQDHTLKHMRAHSRPQLIDRHRRERWYASGAADAYQRAAEKARSILSSHQPRPLPEKTRAEIQSIIAETEGELGVGKTGSP
jgi:trimethylamine--corrinoid protein Co-methyltransferase